MKRLLFGLVVLAMLGVAACSTIEQGITKSYDELTDTTLIKCVLKLPFDGATMGLYESRAVRFIKFPSTSPANIVIMTLIVSANDWHFIDGLTLNVDGELSRLEPYDERRKVYSGSSIGEQISWELPFEVVQGMGKAARTWGRC